MEGVGQTIFCIRNTYMLTPLSVTVGIRYQRAKPRWANSCIVKPVYNDMKIVPAKIRYIKIRYVKGCKNPLISNL